MSVAEVSKRVPVLSCGAVSKKFMTPGWRMGWILIHDKERAFEKEVCTCTLSVCWTYLIDAELKSVC